MKCINCGKQTGKEGYCRHCEDKIDKYHYKKPTDNEDKLNKIKIVVIIVVSLFVITTVIVVGTKLSKSYDEFNSNYNEVEKTPADNIIDIIDEKGNKEKINSP